ncbi:MAG: excinuclease ABC subunit UvrB [Patescibacteria group bacterium]|jgi:excinuclease ABC subunit B|nr:excinuclease ABC subunit UvrB [Patescibacteria group bacterium]
MDFQFKSKFEPKGDQPKAIKQLTEGIQKNYKAQTLLGVTGSGKTFTMAKIIENVQRPTLVMSHNKTLAAQLYNEFKLFFPNNAVHYFVSYYDYYQPEAYIPQSDTYIEKEATINEEIDRLRHAATQSLVNRRDVIIVASVSCIYGIGAREDYIEQGIIFEEGQEIKRNHILKELVRMQFERNDTAFYRGQFRVKGDTIDIHLSTGEGVIRIILFGDVIEKILIFTIKPSAGNPIWAGELRNKDAANLEKINLLPAKHFMTPEDRMKKAVKKIKAELKQRLKALRGEDNPAKTPKGVRDVALTPAPKNVEAYRLERKTNYDIEMMEELGYCNGIENYSRHLSGRKAGTSPDTLIDFFPKDYLMFIDESHVTVPQIGGMFAGDKSRKETLIDFGFRLPSALDNRPLNFAEFNTKVNQVIYASATPREYEINQSKQIVEQLIRPTGLLDPEIQIKKKDNQVADVMDELEKVIRKKQRVLITTLTKRMAEELSEFIAERGVRVEYLHSEIDTLERVEILRRLRTGEIDVLVGVNLLREGLDLPEVALVAILDADISGFLRNETALVQTVGRAARNIDGRVIMYANKMTPAIKFAVAETKRRRRLQEAYNIKNNITPMAIKTNLHGSILGQ